MADKFTEKAEAVKNLPVRPNDQELLKLYGLYKQATAGDNTTAQPWAVQFEARAKWDAWAAVKGTSETAAKDQYVNYVDELTIKYNEKK